MVTTRGGVSAKVPTVDGFVKFPRTPHLVWLGNSSPRGDKLMAAAEAGEWLGQPISVEEKVDGANLGVSLGADRRLRVQSRGHYLGARSAGQWKPLWRWLAQRQEQLLSAIAPSTIAFGEWCYAEHSVFYDSLPDWFLLFDVYDRREDRFWSRRRRDEWARAAGLSTVPLIATGTFGLPARRKLLVRSRLGSAPAEGVYLRWDDRDWLLGRAKIVRPGWTMASDEHWSSGPLKTNRLATAGGSPHREGSAVRPRKPQKSGKMRLKASAMSSVKIEIEESLAAILHQTNQPVQQAGREMIVLELYRRGTISSGKAAELLAMERIDFIKHASRLGIPFFDMTEDEWAAERDRLKAL